MQITLNYVNLRIACRSVKTLKTILRGTRNLSFLTHINVSYICFYLEYNHLVCFVMEVDYISFSFHFFKVKFRETLLSYVIYPFFISMHVHNQLENVKRHFF